MTKKTPGITSDTRTACGSCSAIAKSNDLCGLESGYSEFTQERKIHAGRKLTKTAITLEQASDAQEDDQRKLGTTSWKLT